MTLAMLDEAFDELLSRIELNPTRVTLASQRYNAIKAAIENALPDKSVRQIGSFQRKTKIRPLDLSDKLDIDAIVSFGPFRRFATDGRGVSPALALETIRRALATNELYRVMPQVTDHPIIRLQYADDMSIELAAVFEDLTGRYPHLPGEPNCYIVGSSPSVWGPADYDYDAKRITRLNAATSGKLVPTIKLMKTYLRGREVPLKSFHVEVLAANIVPSLLANWDGNGYDYGYNHILAGFLDRASLLVTRPILLAGSHSPPLNSELDSATLTAIGSYLRQRAEAARRLCAITVGGEAVNRWFDFFGEPFPA